MANDYLTISAITYEMLAVLTNNLVAARHVTRKWESQFAKTGARVGQQIQVRKPPRYVVSDGQTFVPQNYQDEMVPLIIDKHKHVGCEFKNDDLTLSMDDFAGRFLRPAIVPLANQIDRDILSGYAQVWNETGTPGTTAATSTPFLDAKAILFNNAALITDDMPMIVTGKVSARLSGGLQALFNPTKAISDQYNKGAMGGMMKGSVGHALGWDFYEDQNLPTHVTGAWAGASPTVTVAGQTGSSLLTTAWTANITGLGKKGDVFQIAGVNSVNPVSYMDTGELQNFVLTADADSAAGTTSTLQISPAIVVTGKGQTVTNSPAASAAITVWNTGTIANAASKTSPQCMGWRKEAITLACIDLELPGANEGVAAQRVSDDDIGISMVYMRSFDPRQYSRISRIDILYGVAYLRPEHVVRVAA